MVLQQPSLEDRLRSLVDSGPMDTNTNPKADIMDSLPKSDTESLPRSVWILSYVSFFADVSSEMVYPILPLFMITVLGSSKAEFGAMEGAAVLIVALMSAYAGIRSDRKGSRGGRVWWIRWGYGLPVLGKAVIALSTILPLVIGGRLLDRFGKGLRGAPRDALIADAVRTEQRGMAFGLHRAFDTAGAIVGVLISAWLLWWLTGSPQTAPSSQVLETATETPAWVYRMIIGIGAILGLASLTLTFFVRESPDAILAESALKVPSDADLQVLEARKVGELHSASLPSSYWFVLGILVLFSLANSSDAFLLLRARDLGYSPWAVVMVYALYNCLYSLLSYPAGVLSDRFGRWRIIVVGWLVYACVYTGFACLPSTQAWGVWPLMALYGIYMALTDGVGKALIADHAPRESRGKAMGLFYGLTGATTFVASVVAGVVWDRFGALPALLLGAFFAVLAVVALVLLREQIQRPISAGTTVVR